MDGKDYWLQREQLHAEELRKNVSDKNNALMQEYKKTLEAIENDINRNYIRYAEGGNYSMQEAMKLADKMDVERFASKAKRYVEEMDFSPAANADLKLYNLKMRVSRLQLLKMEINLEIDKLAGKLNDETYKHLMETAKKEYERQSGILGEMFVFNPKTASKLVLASYKVGSGFTTFSTNIWRNTEALKSKLGDTLNSAILQGKNPNQYIPEFVKIFGAQHYQAGRLLITETARLQGDVQLDCYKKGGIEWYNIAFEGGACKRCRRVASLGPYKYDMASVGINMYPFHPNCMCSIVPAEEPAGAKAARNARAKKDAENYDYFNDNLKKAFNDKFGKANAAKYISEINATLNNAPETMQKLWKKSRSNFKLEFVDGGSFFSRGKVYLNSYQMNLMNDGAYHLKKNDVFFHEFGHMIDEAGGLSGRDRISKKIYEDFEDFFDKAVKPGGIKISKLDDTGRRGYVDGYGQVRVRSDGKLTQTTVKSILQSEDYRKKKTFDKIVSEIESKKLSKQAYSDVSDVLTGLGLDIDRLGVGHSKKYWGQDGSIRWDDEINKIRLSEEFFAEATSATINNPESLKLIKNYFPKAYAEYIKIIEGVVK